MIKQVDKGEIEEQLKSAEKEACEKNGKQEYLGELEKYVKEKIRIEKKEDELKKNLCHLCKLNRRMVYYSKCEHLALCKPCYSKHEKYQKKCPICYQFSELVIKIKEESKTIFI